MHFYKSVHWDLNINKYFSEIKETETLKEMSMLLMQCSRRPAGGASSKTMKSFFSFYR